MISRNLNVIQVNLNWNSAMIKYVQYLTPSNRFIFYRAVNPTPNKITSFKLELHYENKDLIPRRPRSRSIFPPNF